MTIVRVLASLVCAVVLFSACERAGEPAGAPAAPTPAASPTPTVAQERASSDLPRLKLTNEARGPVRERVKTAISDLKRVSAWRPLTKRLYSLQLQADPGESGVPPDGHLADAMLGAVVDDDGSGTHCSIRFYPAAMKRELATLEEGHAQGVFGPPPTLRQLWAGVLAHELAHCRNWDGAEPYAEKWEAEVLEELRGLSE